MAQIYDETWDNIANVDTERRLYVTGSITSMPSVSVSANTGSEAYIKGGSVSVYNMVAGSIVYMPSVSVSAGSESYVKGGSISVYNMVAGSIVYMPAINVNTGSEVYIKGGSLDGVSQIAGSIWSMPNVSMIVGSESYIKAGSVQTYNPLGIGSVLVINSTGSIGVYGNFGSTGSEQYIMNTVEISGTNIIGSVVIMSAPILGISGIVEVSNMVAGSIVYMPTINVGVGSEVYIKGGSLEGVSQIAGSIWSMPNVSVEVGSKSWIIDTIPISVDRNNPYYTFIYMTSGTATGVTGSSIGSVIQFIGAGSYVQTITYSNDLIINVGSWS